MADLTFRHGNPTFIDYVATADVAAGEVILLGNLTGLTCAIASVPIANGAKGALAVGGSWQGVNLNNAANGAKVYWDNTNKKFTTTSTNNATFGAIEFDGAGGANTNCTAIHDPGLP